MSAPFSRRFFPEKFDTSMWVLVGANLLPLVGVLFWDWSVFEVVALYWLENVIIVGKIALDLKLHRRSHQKLNQANSPA